MRQNLKTVELAREDYAERDVDFDELCAWCMEDGFLINVPYLFALGYFYEENGAVICHLIYTRGDLVHLFRHSLNINLDFIEFERNFSGKTKRYDYHKFTKKVTSWAQTHR